MKRIVSVILTVVMLLSVMLPSASAAVDASKVTPVVVVRGIDFAGLVDTTTGKKAINVEAFDITNIILNFGMNYVKKDEKAIVNTITSLGCDIFKNVKLVYKVIILEYKADEITAIRLVIRLCEGRKRIAEADDVTAVK